MKVSNAKITGLLLIEPDIYFDERGYFFEVYQQEEYTRAGIPPFVQDNESKSKKGVLRGLHYQIAPYEQGKLVRVVSGEVLDVVVDIRRESPTFGHYFSVRLSSENKIQLWIPPGFAHGFVTVSDEAIFAYKCTASYNKESERGILWSDSDLAINWGIDEPIVSDKDNVQPTFASLQ